MRSDDDAAGGRWVFQRRSGGWSWRREDARGEVVKRAQATFTNYLAVLADAAAHGYREGDPTEYG